MSTSLRVTFVGRSITSSWENAHATTYRSLVRGLARLGHRVTFLELDRPWYAENRDEPQPEGCRVELYESTADLKHRLGSPVRDADAVFVGSRVARGAEVVRWVLREARGVRLFYDLDTPMTLENLARGHYEDLSPEVIPFLDAYLGSTDGPELERLRVRYGARVALSRTDEDGARGLEAHLRSLGVSAAPAASAPPLRLVRARSLSTALGSLAKAHGVPSGAAADIATAPAARRA